MPCTFALAVVTSNEPLRRTATRPIYLPVYFPVGTTVRTMSPVWNPLTRLAAFGPVRGKPHLFMRHICREPCPLAVMSKGVIPLAQSESGVLLPTHAASIQCALESPRWIRLYLVSPPLPHSIGSPNVLSLSKRTQRVVFTAAASRSGAFAWARMWARRAGSCWRNAAISCVPFFLLHGSQARQKLLRRLLPPLARQTMCSTCKDTSFASQ